MTPEQQAAHAKAEEKRGAMLWFVRDALTDRALSLRAGFEANPITYCASPEGQAQLKRAVAVEAAVDVFSHLIAEWEKDQKRPEWLRAIVGQAMSAFIEGMK